MVKHLQIQPFLFQNDGPEPNKRLGMGMERILHLDQRLRTCLLDEVLQIAVDLKLTTVDNERQAIGSSWRPGDDMDEIKKKHLELLRDQLIECCGRVLRGKARGIKEAWNVMKTEFATRSAALFAAFGTPKDKRSESPKWGPR